MVNGIIIAIYANLQADQKELKNDIEFPKKIVKNLIFIEYNLTTIKQDSLPEIIGDIHLVTLRTAHSTGFERFSNSATENIILSELKNLITENYK